MKDRILKQYEGFIKTSSLWEGQGPFDLEQFSFPPEPHLFPQHTEIINVMPGLSENLVLGKRMESFFSFAIQNSPEYNLIAENLQIVHDKITIGEIDFILENAGNEDKLHIEMVYKFYLYDPTFKEEVQRWIGPNRKDSLPQKIKKLQDKQLPLLYHPETSRYLGLSNINNQELKQQVCFKAQLFVPLGMLGQTFALINNSCICGYWINLCEFDQKNYSPNEFYIPKKTDWPIDPARNDEWLAFPLIHSMVRELHSRKVAPLVWMKTPENIYQRFFVVWW